MKNIIKISISYIIITTATLFSESFNPNAIHNNQKIDTDTIVTINTEEELKNLLENSMGPCAISFHMDQCGWCIKMHPIFETLAKDNDFEHITFYSVNGPILKAYVHVPNILNEPVTGYPTFLFMNQGKVVGKQIGGASSEDMKGKLNKHLPKSSPKAKKEKQQKSGNKKAQSKKNIVAAAASQAASA